MYIHIGVNLYSYVQFTTCYDFTQTSANALCLHKDTSQTRMKSTGMQVHQHKSYVGDYYEIWSRRIYIYIYIHYI